jgi:hypothetical protein
MNDKIAANGGKGTGAALAPGASLIGAPAATRCTRRPSTPTLTTTTS